MKNFKIYLAGPIAGKDYTGATHWREWVASELNRAASQLVAYSPMRGKDFLKDVEAFTSLPYNENPMTTGEGVYMRDRYDVESSDLVFVNLLGAERVSIGTMFEMAWASFLRKPVITVIEENGNIHEHIFVQQAMGYRVSSLMAGVQLARILLLG